MKEIVRFLIRYLGRFICFFLITAFLLYGAITYFPNSLMSIYWIALSLLVLLLVYSVYLFKRSI
ncbi:hypothetical protein Bmeg_01864 [Bacillus megaterium]|nr:hypothetical protein [Bacillus sp. PvP124]MDP9574661.1 hypothetical protein [Bacillus sp. 1751]MUL30778.1 hypothetical protein [Priestia megaterium]